MDIQGYASHSEESKPLHYKDAAGRFDLSPPPDFKKQSQSLLMTPSSMPTSLPAVSDYAPASQPEMPSSVDSEEYPPSLNPALLLTRYDKRKSSPAIFNLEGVSDDVPLSVQLSQPRNSIDAAILLANFNRLPAETKNTSQWQDDMSIPAHTQDKNTWEGDDDLNEADAVRRYSYDAQMSWSTMPQAFLERSDLLHNPMPTAPSSPQRDLQHQKVTWPSTASLPSDAIHLSSMHPHHTAFYHPYSTANYPSQSDTLRRPTPLMHPLARPPHLPQPLSLSSPQPGSYYPYYVSAPPSASCPPPPMPGMPQSHYYYPPGKMPLPSPMAGTTHASPSSLSKPARRKKARTDGEGVCDEYADGMLTTDEMPDMSEQDVEAARTDPEARPRKQKLRFLEDNYTPKWVRYNGQAKEGLCDTCTPGKWLQLKNSAYWYHKQFFHGISSVSGKEFVQPLETRWVDQDLVEGLCHQCNQWVAVSNVKRKNSVLWYRHAHKCHVYHKPKSNAIKRR